MHPRTNGHTRQQCTHQTGYHLAFPWKGIMAQATACTKLELAVPSETSQSQGEKYRLMHFCVTPRVNLAGAGSRMQAGGNGELAFAGIELQFGVTGKFWRRTVVARAEHSASGRYLLSLNCHPKMAGRVTFVYYIRTKKKKKSKSPILTSLRESICGEGARRAQGAQ